MALSYRSVCFTMLDRRQLCALYCLLCCVVVIWFSSSFLGLSTKHLRFSYPSKAIQAMHHMVDQVIYRTETPLVSSSVNSSILFVDTLPPGTNVAPSSTDKLPSSTDTLPSSTDTLPSSTDKLPSSKVDTPPDQWPSLRGTAITLEEIEEKFQRCKSVSIERDPRCRDAHENSHKYWRPEGGGRVEVIRRMNLASTCCAFNHKELMMPAPHPQLYPWEKDFLSHPPLRDIRDIASADNSKVVLVNDSSTFRLGDIINIQVVLFNGRGERITIGGTSVRVWLVTDSLKAAIAADVTDNLDGTYLASCPLPWSGSVKVKATIAHHRELFRTNFYLQRLFTTTHWLLATFSDGSRSEVTPCSAVPKLPGYNVTDICNLTEVNQFPWYCGKPRDLKCTDWTSVRKLDIPSYYPMTQAEEELIFLTESKRPFMIPSTLTFEVSARTNATATPSPLDPCNKRNLSTTFDDVNSSGYFYNGSWRSLRCQLPVVDREFLIKCLNGTQMLILGDSNSRLQMDFFREMTKCQDKIPRTKVVWHAPLQCDIDNLGVSIKYFPPKHPFYGSMGEDIPNSVLHSTIQIMDGIPATGKYLVHLHQFLHLMPFHLSVAEHHLRLVRAAIQRLVSRNPSVLVVYQTVHSAYDRSKRNKHKMNVFLLELQRRMLRGLGDRVMLAVTWPMTIASENTDGHPANSDQFLKLYMGHLCGRF